MAKRVVDQLVTELSADGAKMRNELQRSLQDTVQWGRQIGGVVSKVGLGLGGLSLAGFVAQVQHAADSASEIKRLADVSQESQENFQKLTFAAQPFGVEQEKLAAILQDVNDRIGDFTADQAGPLTSFFDNIAPKMGLTIEHFKELSGSDALQLYIDSLDKANISQKEFTFYLEALSSDAIKLLPLFRNNGEELARLTQRAEELGFVLNDVELTKLQEVDMQFKEISATFDGVLKKAAVEATPAIKEILDVLSDEGTLRAIGNLTKAMAFLGKQFADITTNFVDLFGDQLAVNVAAIAGNLQPLDELEQKIKDVDRALKGGLNTPIKFIGTPDEELKKIREGLILERDLILAEFSGNAFEDVDFLESAIAKTRGEIEKLQEQLSRRRGGRSFLVEEIEQLTSKLERLEQVQKASLNPPVAQPKSNEDKKGSKPTLTDSDRFFAELLEESKQLDEQVEKQTKTEQKRYERLQESASSYLESLNQELFLVDKKGELDRAVYEIEFGRFKDLDQAQKQKIMDTAELLDIKREEIEVEEQLKEVRESVLTEEERINFYYKEKIDLVGQYVESEEEAARLISKLRAQQSEELKQLSDDAKDAASEFAVQARRNIQTELGDTLYSSMKGDFDNILDAWVDMIQRMIAEAAAVQTLNWAFGSQDTGNGFSGGAVGSFFSGFGNNSAGAAGSSGDASAGAAASSAAESAGAGGGWGNWAAAGAALIPMFAGFFDSGGDIPQGKFGIAGEKGPEIIKGPATVISRVDTKKIMEESELSKNSNNKLIERERSAVSIENIRDLQSKALHSSNHQSTEIDKQTESNKVSLSELVFSANDPMMPTGKASSSPREAGQFAGYFDRGGFIPAGQFGVVGERSVELVSRPGSDLIDQKHMAMNSGTGNKQINQNLNVTIPGRPDRRTPEQIARAASREARRALTRTGK